MTNLESKTITIPQKQERVYDYFCDFNNIGKLMPEQVEEFTTDGNTCSFTIKGMAKLAMEYESKSPYSEVVLKSYGKVPFNFKLRCTLTGNTDSTDVRLSLEADLNPFLKMMAEKPLTNFLNLLVDKCQESNLA